MQNCRMRKELRQCGGIKYASFVRNILSLWNIVRSNYMHIRSFRGHSPQSARRIAMRFVPDKRSQMFQRLERVPTTRLLSWLQIKEWKSRFNEPPNFLLFLHLYEKRTFSRIFCVWETLVSCGISRDYINVLRILVLITVEPFASSFVAQLVILAGVNKVRETHPRTWLLQFRCYYLNASGSRDGWSSLRTEKIQKSRLYFGEWF